MKTLLLMLLILLAGCARISPLSPRLNQKIDNQQGQIEELKNNQNGVNLELGKIRSSNSGVQILSGDGGLLLLCFVVFALLLLAILHYRSKAIKAEQSLCIMAQQIKK